jgi:hypothetical protein
MAIRVFSFWLLLLGTTFAQTPQPIGTASISGKVAIKGKSKEVASMPWFTRFLSCILLCGSTNVLFAQNDKPATASITGRITVKQQPLPGITVTLEAPAMGSSQTPQKAFSAKTDNDGRYRFTGVPKGQHVVSPRAAAYVVPTSGGIMIRPGKDVTIGENEHLENIDFDLTKGGVITGKITDHTGRPLIQQGVTLKKRGFQNRLERFSTPNYSMSFTDDRGVYRLYGLPAGQYFVSVGEGRNDGSFSIGRPGGYLPLTYYPGTPDEAEAKTVDVTEGGEVTDIDIKAGKPEKTYEARGRIIDGTTGTPLIGVQFSYGTIMAGATPRIGSFGMTGERTNAQGEFVMQSLKPGKYAVFMQTEESNDYYSEPTVFEVETGDVEGLEVKAYRGAGVSGMIVVEGTSDPAILQQVKDVRVSVFAAGQTTGLRAPNFVRPTTNADGRFQLTGLQPGKSRVSAMPRPPLQLLRIERDGVETPGEIELVAGEQITGVKIVMGYGTGVIRGQLNVVGGDLPATARFLVIGQRVGGARGTILGQNGNVQVDARGRFVIENLMAGEYELQLVPVGMPGSPPLPGLRLEKQMVVVGAGESSVTFTLNLSEKKEGQQ